MFFMTESEMHPSKNAAAPVLGAAATRSGRWRHALISELDKRVGANP
jgi:hypothetical protein